MTTTYMRPPLRYHGGKWKLAPWIISHFPSHECYVEPFCGGASVFLQKRPAPIEVINDLDGEVVNFFRVLRDHPGELIEKIKLTPFARVEFELSHHPAKEPIERARRFYVRSWQARGGATTQWRTGWRTQKKIAGKNMIKKWNSVDHLYWIAKRLKNALIECDEALKIIQRFDGPKTLFYIDPPYLPELRSQWKTAAYRWEMTEEDHKRLAEALNNIQGMAIISGYPCKLYQELYPGWQIKTKTSVTDRGTAVTEAIWINPKAINQKQLSLWGARL